MPGSVIFSPLSGRAAPQAQPSAVLQAPPAGKKAKRKGSSIRYTALRPAPDKHKDSIHLCQDTLELGGDSHTALPVSNQQAQSSAQVLAL